LIVKRPTFDQRLASLQADTLIPALEGLFEILKVVTVTDRLSRLGGEIEVEIVRVGDSQGGPSLAQAREGAYTKRLIELLGHRNDHVQVRASACLRLSIGAVNPLLAELKPGQSTDFYPDGEQLGPVLVDAFLGNRQLPSAGRLMALAEELILAELIERVRSKRLAEKPIGDSAEGSAD
jgi:hypothetical protein